MRSRGEGCNKNYKPNPCSGNESEYLSGDIELTLWLGRKYFRRLT